MVTGGAGAIGSAIAAELAVAGHTVVSLDQASDPPVDLGQADLVRATAADVLRRHTIGLRSRWLGYVAADGNHRMWRVDFPLRE